MVLQVLNHIDQTNGAIRISTLNKLLYTCASPLEKRFRDAVGISGRHENHYFDQAHFIKDFKTYTGETPEQFAREKRE